jgi:hypothetical protein
LGIGHQVMFRDLGGRPQHATLGEPLYPLLGEEPATMSRREPEGNVNLVPPYSKAPIFERSFEENRILAGLGSKQRFTRWMAKPLATTSASPDFGVTLIEDSSLAATGSRCAALGIGLSHSAGHPAAATLPARSRAILTQQVRNPRAGTYVVKVKAACGGAKADWEWLTANFQFRLSLFGYHSLDKNPWNGVREYASLPITPRFAEDGSAPYQEFSLTKPLRSQDGGASEIEMGVGIAIWMERRTPGDLAIDAGRRALLRVDDFEVTFTPRPRNDNVTV